VPEHDYKRRAKMLGCVTRTVERKLELIRQQWQEVPWPGGAATDQPQTHQ